MSQETQIEDEVANLKVEDTKEEKKIISLEILKIIKDAQQQHGLRHSDYQRYRGYCSRRIRRLRKTLHLAQADKRHYKRKDVNTSHLSDERFLYIPLMMAERAWSYAMQLRQEANTEPRKMFHMKSRLRKASSYALQLQTLCQSDVCDARTKLEAQGYVAWIQGSLLFELQLWHNAMEQFQQAQMVYSKLVKAVNEDEATLYRHRVEEIQPSLRYCAYNVGDQSAISDLQNMRTTLGQDSLILDKLDALMDEARSKLKSVEEVEWRGKRITVKPVSVGSFLAAEQALAQTKTDMDTLERHLTKCRDAISAVRESMSEQGGGGKGKQSGVGPGGGQLLLSYLIHIRLSRTIQRILLIIEKTKEQESEAKEGKKPKGQDLIRLYEMILQNLSEMQQLHGLEDDKDYQKSVDDDINWYKAHRCFYMSEVLCSSKHYKEAYAILERAYNYATKVAGARSKSLIEQIETNKHLALAQTAFQTASPQPVTPLDQDKKNSKNAVPLIDRLDEYVEEPCVTSSNPNFVHFPPEMQPVAYKPLFFDIAVNHLALPKLDDKPAKQQQQQGISGFVKGLWGGWSK